MKILPGIVMATANIINKGRIVMKDTT